MKLLFLCSSEVLEKAQELCHKTEKFRRLLLNMCKKENWQ